MDLRTAAAYLGCSYWTLRDLVLNGYVPAVRIPSPRARDGRALRRTLIDSRDLELLIERWKEGNTAASTNRIQPGGRNGNALQARRSVVDQDYRNGRGLRESSHSTKEGDARRLLKLREGDIEHGLPVDPKLNRIRFEEAAEDLKMEYAVNGRRSADELERRIRLHLMPHFGGRRLAAIATTDINKFILTRQADVMVAGERPRPARGAESPSASERGWGPASSEKSDDRKERRFSNGEINRELNDAQADLQPGAAEREAHAGAAHSDAQGAERTNRLLRA